MTRPAPARPAARQTSSAAPGVVERAGDHEQLAERALVAALRPLGQQRRRRPRRRASTAPGTGGRRRRSAGRPRAARSRPAGQPSRRPVGRASGARPPGVRASLVQRAEPLHPGEEPPLAVVEPLLDVEREDVAAAGRPDAERDRDRVVGLVA